MAGKRLWSWLAAGLRFCGRLVRGLLKWSAISGVAAIVLIFLSNILLFPTSRNIPSRALDPDSRSCADARPAGWDILASTNNDEWRAIDKDKLWESKLSCSIQRHVLPVRGSSGAQDQPQAQLGYDLAFIEFQEDGKPYALRKECEPHEQCTPERSIAVRRQRKGQLEAVIEHLDRNKKQNIANYVIVFVHGWRHDASIGDSDVQNFRIYAAHAARFVADRAAVNPAWKDTRVTAIYIGWRGARTDETWLARNVPWIGGAIGSASAVITLFDRKPVSEAIAPSALSALRAIENKLGIDGYSELPAANPNRMIVFGHSLGGNMLMTALQDDLMKKVTLHSPRSYAQPVLGDLVVLINPASEASKWTAVQRTLWRRLALVNGERRPGDEYAASHTFFREDQRPIFISVTSARNWPPGGRQQLDCPPRQIKKTESAIVQRQIVDYDWATHDMFPAFKGDPRPLADRIEAWGTQSDPNDECERRSRSLAEHFRHPLRTAAVVMAASLRVLPFIQTDPEQTQTIGNLDPPRSPRGNLKTYGATMRPFGTTHELRASNKGWQRGTRKMSVEITDKEVPVTYQEVTSPEAACPVAARWLTRTRNAKILDEIHRSPGNSRHFATNWDTYDLKRRPVPDLAPEEGFPALRFSHGFDIGGISPPTRPNDPFWNIRAFDNALAEHDGYMLSSFICAMNQLVLDDITLIIPPPPPRQPCLAAACN